MGHKKKKHSQQHVAGTHMHGGLAPSAHPHAAPHKGPLHRGPVDNSVFGGLTDDALGKLRAHAIPSPSINLTSSYMDGRCEPLPVAEVLVAYDPKEQQILKFIAAFIPAFDNVRGDTDKHGVQNSRYPGKKFRIATWQDRGNPMHAYKAITGPPTDNPEVSPDKPRWNPATQVVDLHPDLLPIMALNTVEWRLLRFYRKDVPNKHRAELLRFPIPADGGRVDKRMIQRDLVYYAHQPLQIAMATHTQNTQRWAEKLCADLTRFSGVHVELSLGLDSQVKHAVAAGQLNHPAAELLVDESAVAEEKAEAPVEHRNRMGVTPNTGGEGSEYEGDKFFVPPHPIGRKEPLRETLKHATAIVAPATPSAAVKVVEPLAVTVKQASPVVVSEEESEEEAPLEEEPESEETVKLFD